MHNTCSNHGCRTVEAVFLIHSFNKIVFILFSLRCTELCSVLIVLKHFLDKVDYDDFKI